MWIMEVSVKNPETNRWEWQAVHPTGGTQYEYTSKDDAQSMLNMCYGSPTKDQARIREIKED